RRGVEFVHGLGDALGHQGVDRLARGAEHLVELCGVISGEIGEDPRADVTTSGTSDADTETEKITRPQRAHHVAQAVVATMTAAAFERDATKVEVELVVDDHDPLDRDPVKVRG